MVDGSRSLNLANAVAAVVYDAWRRQGYPGAAGGGTWPRRLYNRRSEIGATGTGTRPSSPDVRRQTGSVQIRLIATDLDGTFSVPTIDPKLGRSPP